jgi:hypothetical protein
MGIPNEWNIGMVRGYRGKIRDKYKVKIYIRYRIVIMYFL